MTIVCCLLFSYIPAIAIVHVVTAVTPPDTAVGTTGDLQPTFIYLKPEYKLSPEVLEPDATQLQIPCPPETEPLLPWLPGIFIIKYVWTKLPITWNTEPLRTGLKIGGPVIFTLYLISVDDPTMSAQFRLRLKLDTGVELAVTPEPTDYITVTDKEPTVVELSAGVNYTGEIPRHSKLILEIEYFVNGDGMVILYGAPNVPSGLNLPTNGIKILNVMGCKHGVGAKYTEAFGVAPAKLLFEISVDDTRIHDSQPKFSAKPGGTMVIHWRHPNKPGTHTATVSISYGGLTNSTWTFTGEFVIKLGAQPWFKIASEHYLFITAGILLAIILTIVVVVSTIRSRRRIMMEIVYSSSRRQRQQQRQ